MPHSSPDKVARSIKEDAEITDIVDLLLLLEDVLNKATMDPTFDIEKALSSLQSMNPEQIKDLAGRVADKTAKAREPHNFPNAPRSSMQHLIRAGYFKNIVKWIKGKPSNIRIIDKVASKFGDSTGELAVYETMKITFPSRRNITLGPDFDINRGSN